MVLIKFSERIEVSLSSGFVRLALILCCSLSIMPKRGLKAINQFLGFISRQNSVAILNQAVA